MALLEIKKAGAPVLKEVCRPIERVDNKIKKLLDDMAETMYAADGVGLAAVAVKRPVRRPVAQEQANAFKGHALERPIGLHAMQPGGGQHRAQTAQAIGAVLFFR